MRHAQKSIICMLVMISMLVLATSAHAASPQANWWTFGNKLANFGKLDSDGRPEFSNASIAYNQAPTALSDNSGNLLVAANKGSFYFPNGTKMNAQLSVSSSYDDQTVLLPVAGSDTEAYFIIADGSLSYAKLDYTTGELTTNETQISSNVRRLTVVDDASGTGYWIAGVNGTFGSGNDMISLWHLHDNGTFEQVAANNTKPAELNSYSYWGALKFSPDAKKIALISYKQVNTGNNNYNSTLFAHLYDFNNSNGTITFDKSINKTIEYDNNYNYYGYRYNAGAAFTAKSKYLYFAGYQSYYGGSYTFNNPLYRYNLEKNGEIEVVSEDIFNNTGNYYNSYPMDISLSPEGDLYAANYASSTGYLRIVNPEAESIGSNGTYTNSSNPELASNVWFLPNFNQSWLRGVTVDTQLPFPATPSYATVNATIDKTALDADQVLQEWGLVWSNETLPTTSSNKTVAVLANSSMSVDFTTKGLEIRKPYYLRPYAIVDNGTQYGDQKILKIYVDPVVDTSGTKTFTLAGDNGTLHVATVEAGSYKWISNNATLDIEGNATNNATFVMPVGVAGIEFQVTVTDTESTLVKTGNVTVVSSPIPTAKAGADQIAMAGTTVTLNGTGSTDPLGATLEYKWTQPDGQNITLSATNASMPTFTAPAETKENGTVYTFTLNVNSTGGTSPADNATVTVYPVPDVNITVPASVLPGQNATLNATTKTGYTYAWAQANGTTVSLTNASTDTVLFTMPASGDVGLTLLITDSHGFNATKEVTVLEKPSANVTVSSFQSTAGLGSLKVESKTGYSYTWAQTGGPTVQMTTPNAAETSFNMPSGVTDGGTKLTFTVTITGPNGATDTKTVTTTVAAPPAADTTGSSSIVLPGQTGTLKVATVTNGTYLWEQVNGTTTAINNASTDTATFTMPNATVSLGFRVTVTNTYTSFSSTKDVIVLGDLTPKANAGADQIAMAGTTVTLNATASTDPVNATLQYIWTQPAGQSVTLSNASAALPTFTAPAETNENGTVYTFSLAVNSTGGLSPADNATVTVYPIPDVNLTVPVSVLPGENATINATTKDGYKYTWTQANGTTVALVNSTNQVSFTMPASGDVGISLTITDSHGFNATKTALVLEKPNASANVTAYQDTTGLGTIAVEEKTGYTYSWTQTGGSSVTLTTPNAASTSFNMPTGVGAAGEELTFVVTITGPNGATNTVTVKTTAMNPPSIDTTGTTLLVVPGETATLKLAPFTNGTYLWEQVNGTTVSLANATADTASFTMPAAEVIGLRTTATNSFTNLSSTKLVEVYADVTPTAAAGSNQIAMEGTTVTLNGTATHPLGGAMTYAWTQPEGQSIALSNASVLMPTFTAPATTAENGTSYTFSLVASASYSNGTQAAGAASNMTVTVYPTPDVNITVPVSVLPGATATVNATAKDQYTYTWTQANGTTVTLNNSSNQVSFTMPASGDVGLSLVVTDAQGFNATKTVTVLEKPTATASAATFQTTADLGTLTVEEKTGYTYVWTQTGGPSVTLTMPNASTTSFNMPTSVGDAGVELTFVVTMTGPNGATNTATVTTTAMNPPAIDTTGTSVYVVPGNTGTLTMAAFTNGTYLWEQVNGTTGNLTNASSNTASFTMPEVTYSLGFRVTATNTYTNLTSTKDVIVYGDLKPTANAGADQIAMSGTTVTLNATGSIDPMSGAMDYTWSQPAGQNVALSSANVAMPTFTAPATTDVNGTAYIFSVVANSTGGASPADNMTVTVYPVPDAVIGVPTSVLPGDNATVSAEVKDGYVYTWTQLNGTTVALTGANASQVSFTMPASGDVGLQLILTDSHGFNATKTVTVLEKPYAASSTSEYQDSTASGTLSVAEKDGYTYQWVQTGGPTVTLTTPTAASTGFTMPSDVSDSGTALTFEVTVTAANGATNTITITTTAENPPAVVPVKAYVEAEPGTATVIAVTPVDGCTYAWNQTGGLPVTLKNSDQTDANFTMPGGYGGYEFTVTLTSAHGISASGKVAAQSVAVPVADAGMLKKVTEGDTVVLVGANSAIKDGTALTYKWEQLTGTTVNLVNATSENATFVAPVVVASGESLTFQLTVNSTRGITDSAKAFVNVTYLNDLPVANAGPDVTAAPGDTITLSAASSYDPDNGTMTYEWEQIGGTLKAALSSTNTVSTSLTPSESGTARYRLTVTDNDGLKATDDVIVNVLAVAATDEAPIADAGPDQNVNNGKSVRLSGMNSYAIGNNTFITSWKWSQLAGSEVSLTNPLSAKTRFTAPEEANATESLVFELAITDSNGMTGRDVVTVSVIPNNVVPPVADAGTDINANANALVTLNATGSIATGSSISAYSWKQLEGTNVALTGVATATPSFTTPNLGSGGECLVFRLTVTNAQGLTATDTVVVNVALTATPPTANAGVDQNSTEGSTVTLNATQSAATEAGATLDSYKWNQVSGPYAPLSDASSATPTFVCPAVDTNSTVIFEVTVIDSNKLEARDRVVINFEPRPSSSIDDDKIEFVAYDDVKELGIESGNSSEVVALAPVDPATIAQTDNRPEGITDYGLIDFTVKVERPGDNATVVVELPEAAPENARWYKYNTTNATWVDFSHRATFSADRKTVSITLTDGGEGDDDGVANGRIIDPSGLGSASSSSTDTNVSNHDGGCTVSSNAGFNVDILMLLLGVALIAMRRRVRG